MAEFTPITSQEQLDGLIGERIKRERETAAKKYADYDALKTRNAELENQLGEMTRSMEESAKKYAGYDKNLSELQAQVKGYETASVKTRIALEAGLPYELAARLNGESEEDIRKDAQSLAGFMKSSRQPAPPLKSTESSAAGNAEIHRMLNDLRGE